MKNNLIKNIIRVLVVSVIVFSIFYFESKKPPRLSGSAPDVLVNYATTSADSLADKTLSTTSSSANKISSSIVADRASVIVNKSSKYSKAKEIVQPAGFINADSVRLSDFTGKKVILIDFWTYSCINCIRTIPYLNAWYQKYKDLGLVIVGVHTPEFDFEKNYDNVAKAVKNFGIEYPVVLDSSYGTWNAYNNHYWPAEYLIDVDGFVIHSHFGEGNYDETEQAIQSALMEKNKALGIKENIPTGIVNLTNEISATPFLARSPETYFGSARNEYLGNGKRGFSGKQALNIPSVISGDILYLGGDWDFTDQYAENTGEATIVYKYNAKNVYFVANSENGVKIKITLDDAPIGALAGKDVSSDGTVLIKENKLYDIIKGVDYGEHTLRIEIPNAGLQAFTFTFG